MSYIRVASQRKGGTRPKDGELLILIDRPNNRILGNRHRLVDHRDAVQRDACVDAYDEDLDADFAREGPMYQEVNRLAQLVEEGQPLAFICWCAPDRCHGHSLKFRIELKLNRKLDPPDERPVMPVATQSALF